MHFEIRLIVIILVVVVILLVLAFRRERRARGFAEIEYGDGTCDPAESVVCAYNPGDGVFEYFTSLPLGDQGAPIEQTCNLPPGYVVTGFNMDYYCLYGSLQMTGRELLPDGTLGTESVTTCLIGNNNPSTFVDFEQVVSGFTFRFSSFEYPYQILDGISATTTYGEEFDYVAPSGDCGGPFEPTSFSFQVPPGHAVIGFSTNAGPIISNIAINYVPLTVPCDPLFEGFPLGDA